MEGLLNDPVIQSDFGTYNIVLRNAFIHTGKSCYIHKAYRQSMEKDSTIPLNAVYEILLSRHYIQGAEKTRHRLGRPLRSQGISPDRRRG